MGFDCDEIKGDNPQFSQCVLLRVLCLGGIKRGISPNAAIEPKRDDGIIHGRTEVHGKFPCLPWMDYFGLLTRSRGVSGLTDISWPSIAAFRISQRATMVRVNQPGIWMNRLNSRRVATMEGSRGLQPTDRDPQCSRRVATAEDRVAPSALPVWRARSGVATRHARAARLPVG